MPGWRDRCKLIGRFGQVEFFHFDFTTQALAKIERGHTQDLLDAGAMLERRLTSTRELSDGFAAIEPQLLRYPNIEPEAFRRKVSAFLAQHEWAI